MNLKGLLFSIQIKKHIRENNNLPDHLLSNMQLNISYIIS